MRSILSICFLVLLTWKVNGDTTLHPSVSNQHEGTSEGQRPSTKGEATSNGSINTHKEDSKDLISSGGVFSTNSHFTQNQHSTGKSHGQQEVKMTTEERVSFHRSSSLTTGKKQTKRNSEDPQSNQTTSTSAIPSQFTQDQHSTGRSHETYKTDMQTTTEERASIFHSSSATVKKQTKRSLEDQTTAVSTPNNSVHITTGQEHPTPQESNSTKNGVTNKREEILKSTEKILTPQSSATSAFPMTPAVAQTDMQTKWSKHVQENKSDTPSAPGMPKQHTTNSTTALVTTGKNQTNTVPAISNSSMEATATVNSFTTSRSSFPGNISTLTMETVPTTTPTKDIKTTHEIVRRGTTTTRQASTTKPMTTLSTTRRTTPKSETPQNKKRKDKGKNSPVGPIVASIIGTVMVLMFIAIMLILVRKRRMQKKQHENTDWAGPSPFLEGDAQPNQPGGDGPFHRWDTKRISLHSFFPPRASQRLSLLMEEEVQMNDIAENSTFGRNEQAQNGKPAVENDQIQTSTTDDHGPAPEVSSSVPETETATVTPANIQNSESDETIPSSSSETKATPPPSPSFEEVKLNPPQTNAVNCPPAPPLP